MATKRVLRNEITGKEYEVVSVDEENHTVTLKGELCEFTEPLDWDRFKAMGYKRKSKEVEEEDA
jgi:hypothetical protein